MGKVVFATWRPHEAVVLEIIQDLGIEYQIIFNKRAVMVLPSGINKATGLAHVLKRLKISPQNVVGIGDAENDHAFLDSCAVAAAVDNALPALKERCDLVMSKDHGAGVVELIDRILADDLQSLGVRAAAKTDVPSPSPLPREDSMDVLVIDVGGSSVKLWHTGHQEHRKFESGKDLLPDEMVEQTARSPRTGPMRPSPWACPAGSARAGPSKTRRTSAPAGSGSISPPPSDSPCGS